MFLFYLLSNICIMITMLESGKYEIAETARDTKILILGKKIFAIIMALGIGEILVSSQKDHKFTHTLAKGSYRIYKVKDEPNLADLLHLELFVGEGKWQGYLLPTGLPTNEKKRNRIIPTSEIITKFTH